MRLRELVKQALLMNAGDSKGIKLSCRPGEVVVGTGFEEASSSGPPPSDGAILIDKLVLKGPLLDLKVESSSFADPETYRASALCVTSKVGPGERLDTSTVHKSVDINPFMFGIVQMKCGGATYPTSTGFATVSDGVNTYPNVPAGTAHTQPVQFLNTTSQQQSVDATLTCVRYVG
jgi:hypothetical protein